MKIDALMMDEKDNVVTCVREVKAGETVKFRMGNEECEITAKEDIPSAIRSSSPAWLQMMWCANMER